MADIFDRQSTTLTISEFYDNYINHKYNFTAAYQRHSDIWSDEKKSFLIDSIIKNYPIPAIFLRPTVDNATGRTVYDVIDGKQRLETIVSFIQNDICISTNFSEDKLFSIKKLPIEPDISGLRFNDIKESENCSSYMKQFWTYSLNIQYLYEQDEEIIASVFDRLNRNGEPLTGQELRNAKYAHSSLLGIIKELSDRPFWKKILLRLKSSRMEDQEFISELFFIILEDKIIGLSPLELDNLYERHKNIDINSNIKDKFIKIEKYIIDMNINFEKNKRLYGTTHIYTIFTLAWMAQQENYLPQQIGTAANNFYELYFSKCEEVEITQPYKEASSSRTRSEIQRKKRLDCIFEYCKSQQSKLQISFTSSGK